MTRILAQHAESKLDVQHLDKRFQVGTSENSVQVQEAIDLWNLHKVETVEKEKEVIARIVLMSGSMSKAAKLIGIAKSTLHDKMKDLGLQINKLLEGELCKQ